jgi:hypothetical protein
MNDINEDLLYETPWIGGFLAPDSNSRFLVVATKGFGKTLLLRAKRLRMEAARQGIHYLPENSLTDKPLSLANVFSKQDVKRIKEDPLFWSNLWLMAITVAVIKVARRLGDVNVHQLTADDFESDLGDLLGNNLRTITDLFAQILTFSAGQHFKARIDLQRRLGPAFRSIHTPIVAFIDNVDQHFDAHILPSERGSHGTTDKAIWYSAQTGLAVAIRDLHPQNNHVKIFASIRNEAFAQLLHDSAMSQQIEGSALAIQYQPEDLRQIFIKNLLAEPDDNCVAPKSTDPFLRFFGAANMHLDHNHVGESEDIWSYIARHTLGRPRDFMTVGYRLSQILPGNRSPANIRTAVNAASETIGAAYLNEIKGHLALEIDFTVLFGLIQHNILTADKVRIISLEYNDLVRTKDGAHVHVFCALYKVGLLGYVTRDVGTANLVQRFARPGALLFAGDGVLPKSSHYVVHPALDAHIRLRASQYTHDTLNIAGQGRKWRDSGGAYGVVKIDIVGSSRILDDPELSRTFNADFAMYVKESSAKISGSKIGDGDAVWLTDRNPVNLIMAATDLAQQLLSSRYKAQLRAGAEFGVTEVPGGPVFRTAARLEAVGAPNALLVTREFRDQVLRIDDRVKFKVGTTASSLINVERVGETYNIRKSEADPDLYKEVFVVDLV